MPSQRIQIVCPAPPHSQHGNRITALRWRRILSGLGHRVRIVDDLSGSCDLLVALHAKRSGAAIQHFRQHFPDRPLIVAVTGTDLYRDGQHQVTQTSLRSADRIVVLQAATQRDLAPSLRRKTRVIHQSVTRSHVPRPRRPRQRRVIVAGHLRAVKDPFRAAMAVRSLPANSRIEVHHFGGCLEPKLLQQARAEHQANPRYYWHGEVTRSALRRTMARSWLIVLSSRMEGGANVLTEAIVNDVPALATRIPGSIGILGKAYRGYFEVGATRELRELLLACERDHAFYEQLRQQIRVRARLFTPERERLAWSHLLEELVSCR